MNQEILTESELAERQGTKTYNITLTAEQRKLIRYTAYAFIGYFVARHLVKSTLKTIREE